MSHAEPAVSVVIPVFDCARYLGDAIASVLAQTRPVAEVLVVDDGSSDESGDVARRFGAPVRYVRQAHAGIAAARNRGVELTHGDLLAFLDADDLWLPEKLAVQLAALAATPALDMVFGHVEQFISPDLAPAMASRLRCPEGAVAGLLPGTVLIRRPSFLRVGMFDTSYPVGEVLDWHLRAVETGLAFEVVRETVLRRRLHDNNQGIRERGSRDAYAAILKAALDRRRRAAAESS